MSVRKKGLIGFKLAILMSTVASCLSVPQITQQFIFPFFAATDCHSAINSICRKEKTSTRHSFDNWQTAKGECKCALSHSQHLATVFAQYCSGLKKLKAACNSCSCASIRPHLSERVLALTAVLHQVSMLTRQAL